MGVPAHIYIYIISIYIYIHTYIYIYIYIYDYIIYMLVREIPTGSRTISIFIVKSPKKSQALRTALHGSPSRGPGEASELAALQGAVARPAVTPMWIFRGCEWHWIGLLGKILTGNPWVFTIKLVGFSCKISHNPIL